MTFRLLRYYSVASLVAVLLAAVAIVAMYRAIAIRGIETIAEGSNLTVAHLAITPIRAQLAEYLTRASNPEAPDGATPRLPPELDSAIDELMKQGPVVRVKLYNRQGVVSYSTKPEQIGGNQSANPGFQTAMNGRVSVKLVYRDTLNPFDGVTEDDNLVQSYVPVRRRATEPVAGVFEIYTDVGTLVTLAERFEMLLFAGTVGVLAVLYLVLILVVRRMGAVIQSQALTIREKTALLETLSRESLRREERERKKLATHLHEGLAQTLSAVKMAVEQARRSPAGEGQARLESVVPDLQEAIDTVRAIASDLRPSSLDDLGLVASIQALCREFAENHPRIAFASHVAVPESLVPPPLKIVIYRSVEAALRIIAEARAATSIAVRLEVRGQDLALAIELDGADALVAFGPADTAAGPESPFNEVRERVIISGGRLAFAHGPAGAVTMSASWSLAGKPAAEVPLA